MQYPSIFNDVLGPVMKGPSSSHTAASLRVGLFLRGLFDEEITNFNAVFDHRGSLAPTYHVQYSDAGLIGGLLGMSADDDDMINSIDIATKKGMKINFEISEYENTHPNTYKMHIYNDKQAYDVVALSVGGGMFEVINIDGFEVFCNGGFYETFICLENKNIDSIVNDLSQLENVSVSSSNKEDLTMINIKSYKRLDVEVLIKEYNLNNVTKFMQVDLILPILSQITPNALFESAQALVDMANATNKSVAQLAMEYEANRGNVSVDQVKEQMHNLLKIMRNSIRIGLNKTYFKKRILQAQAYQLKPAFDANKLIGDSLTMNMLANVSAIMESKSAFETFVAAPTAGSCGALVGSVIAIGDELKASDEKVVEALFVAGIIGVFIAHKSTFAAEVAGCQAECGAGSGMAAAAMVSLKDGSAQQVVDAASMALQNILGMVCDNVASGVEVPCLGKNAMSAMNALGAANMILADFDAVINLDETIIAFDEVGRSIPCELRCTSLGGVAITKTALEITEKLKQMEEN